MNKTTKEIRLEDIVEIILRRRWWIILPFCLSIIIAITLAFTLPKYYNSQALILIQPPELPANFVQPMVTMDIDSRFEVFSRQILSRSNLEKIMKDFNMYTEPDYDSLFPEDKIAEMRKRITVELIRREMPKGFNVGSNAYAFSISYEGKEPENVMKVTNALASHFIEENTRFRKTEAMGTSKFLNEELESIREELMIKEKELKEYREKYMGELPEQLNSNLSMIIRLEEQLKAKQTSLLDAQNKLAMVMGQVKEGTLLFGQGVSVTNDGRIVTDFDKPISLEQARAMLSYLETRYTSKHPDIIRIKKIISDLEKSRQSNQDVSDVFQYVPQNTKMEIENIKTNIKTLTADIADLKSQIQRYERHIDNTPGREQELLSLKRDYDNKRARYDLLLNKKLETEVSVSMEEKQKGEKFRILDRAWIPMNPVFPNLKLLFLLVLVVGPNIGLGLIFLLEYLDSSFRSPKDIESELGFPVLATIPIIQDQKYKRRQRMNQVFSIVSIVFSVILLSAFAVLSFVGVDQTMLILNKIMTA